LHHDPNFIIIILNYSIILNFKFIILNYTIILNHSYESSLEKVVLHGMYSGIIPITLKPELHRQLPAVHFALISRCSRTNVRNLEHPADFVIVGFHLL